MKTCRFSPYQMLRLSGIVLTLMLLTAAYVRVHSASTMADCAKDFLASLSPEQRARATFAFSDEQRYDWHFIPRPRKGLPLKDMEPYQQHLAHALLSAGLSQRGYIKATRIMTLDDILRTLEHGTGPVRDPMNYYVTIFGEPSATGTWGYRFEGHHVSQNFTVVNGRVTGSPSFFGANPAKVLQGPRQGLRVLGREEDAGVRIQRPDPVHARD